MATIVYIEKRILYIAQICEHCDWINEFERYNPDTQSATERFSAAGLVANFMQDGRLVRGMNPEEFQKHKKCTCTRMAFPTGAGYRSSGG